MVDDVDPGVDKFDLLAAINGEPPVEPPPLPEAEPLPAPEPAAEAAVAPPEPAPASSPALRRPSRWSEHRHEIAALAAAFVGVVWLAVGIAVRAWAPSLVGIAFCLGALLIGAVEIWGGD